MTAVPGSMGKTSGMIKSITQYQRHHTSPPSVPGNGLHINALFDVVEQYAAVFDVALRRYFRKWMRGINHILNKIACLSHLEQRDNYSRTTELRKIFQSGNTELSFKSKILR